MKRIICVLVSLAILVLCMSALAEENIWQYNEMNMYLQLNGVVSGDVEVPAEVNGYTVKALQYNMFSGNDEITSLRLPDSVEALGSNAISWMDALSSVQLSANLVAVERDNFSNCKSLTSITFPASVCYIEDAIYGCENLREIRFTGACPVFFDNDTCFRHLPEDCVIYVPDDQIDAYKAAMANMSDAVNKIQPSGANAVLVDYTIPESDLKFDASTGTIVAYYGNAARIDIPAMIGNIPVKHIGASAFSTYAIRYAVLPEGIETINKRAFYQASNLRIVKFPSTLRTIGEEAFYNAQAYIIEWNEGLEEIGPKAFMYDYEPILSLPTTLKTIGVSAFESAKAKELYLGNQISSIGARAFAKSRISYMAFDLYAPIEIAPDAFDQAKVADLDLPWDSSEANRLAFASLLAEQCPDCTVWINNPISAGVAVYPANQSDVIKITDGVWTEYHGNDESLTVWTAYDDIYVSGLGNGLFKGNQSIRRFYPHHCGWFTTIGAEAFADSSVEYVDMFGSITTIGREAFRNCVNITDLTLPSSVTEVGDNAFIGCTGLQRLTVLCDPTILPEKAFADSTSLVEIYAAADATKEQVRALGAAVNRPWYLPVPRIGEAMPTLQTMPYEPLPADDFEYDAEYARLDRYNGYEVNLVLPREINGTVLSILGGNMMTRASYGDNFDMELPVLSVVVPETYREITYWGFANCETLDTVVFYAPIETIPDGFFSGCTNLRNVIFVNGVRYLGRNIFAGCPNLETVYLGELLEGVDDYAFTDGEGRVVFSLEQCIQSADAMPDVDALLAAVKSDPIPAPEPTQEPVMAVPVPIGPEGEAFFGTWYGVSMEMDGETYNVADIGMAMQIVFNADGTVVLTIADDVNTAVWTVSGNTAMIETSVLTLTENGDLMMNDDGGNILFSREAVTFAPVPVGEDGAAFVGTWYGITMEMEGTTYSLSDFGMDMKLTLNADGTAEMVKDGDVQTSVWQYADGVASVAGSQLYLLEDGGMYMDEDGTKVVFSHTPASPADPGTIDVAPEVTQTPATQAPITEVPTVSMNIDERMETKYTMESADMQGMNMSAAMLGGYEYSLVFHANGTVDFVMAGASVPALQWTRGMAATEDGEKDALIIDYYGIPMNAVITEQGFDMNYMDTMMIHFVAEK